MIFFIPLFLSSSIQQANACLRGAMGRERFRLKMVLENEVLVFWV